MVRNDHILTFSLGIGVPFADTIERFIKLKLPSFTPISMELEWVRKLLKVHESADHTVVAEDGSTSGGALERGPAGRIRRALEFTAVGLVAATAATLVGYGLYRKLFEGRALGGRLASPPTPTPSPTATPTLTPTPRPTRPQPLHESKPKPSPEHQRRSSQYAVLPADGIYVRTSPSIGSAPTGTFREGTFVRSAGVRRIDADHDEWLFVSGPGARGWVEARFLELHPEGADGPAGRIDPTLARQGFKAVTVLSGETLSQIANDSHVDPQAVFDLVRRYMVDPNRIFPGDTVYMPRTASG
jgi:hypothetical protein